MTPPPTKALLFPSSASPPVAPPSLNATLLEKQESSRTYRLDRTVVERYLEKGTPVPESSDSSDSHRVSRSLPAYPSHAGTLEVDGGGDPSSNEDCPRHKSSFVWRTLGHLTLLNPLLSLFNALYTLIVLALVALSFPFKYLVSSDSATISFSHCLIALLEPQLCFHLRFLHPNPCPQILMQSFGALRLVIVHLLSPFFAIPLSITAGCVAFAWMYTEIILGEKNDRKGMEYRSFLFVKHFWEEFILSSLSPKNLQNGGAI